jgi:hypothetical protein
MMNESQSSKAPYTPCHPGALVQRVCQYRTPRGQRASHSWNAAPAAPRQIAVDGLNEESDSSQHMTRCSCSTGLATPWCESTGRGRLRY